MALKRHPDTPGLTRLLVEDGRCREGVPFKLNFRLGGCSSSFSDHPKNQKRGISPLSEVILKAVDSSFKKESPPLLLNPTPLPLPRMGRRNNGVGVGIGVRAATAVEGALTSHPFLP